MGEKKLTSIGGQAVIEGVMMRGPHKTAVAVRKPDGEIIIDEKETKGIGKWAKVPIIRGVVSFISSMVIGVQALMFSAKFFDIEEDKNDKKNVGGDVHSAPEKNKTEKSKDKEENILQKIFSTESFLYDFENRVTDYVVKKNDFTIKTKSKELDINESFSVMAFYMYGGMYNLYSGEEIDNVHVKFVNSDSGETISESNSKDAESEE